MRPLVAATLAIAMFSTVARADDAQDQVRARLEAGQKSYQDQDYRSAIEALGAVVKDPVATLAQRARAYEYLGMAWLIVGKKPRAREAFEELLAIDPHYTLSDPSHSPKLREFFEDVRARFVPGYGHAAGEAELEHAAPTAATAGRPLEIDADVIRGAMLVNDVTLHHRHQGLLAYAAEPMKGEAGRWRLKLAPPRDSVDYELEYYLEARDDKGRVVARVGSPEAPLRLRVHGAPLPIAPATPWYKRWYVWAAVAAVAAGAAVGGIVYGTAEHAPSGTLPPGRVSLGLHF